jgi:CRP/FNR family transcriptional regulator, cyclic AMP receptor protein
MMNDRRAFWMRLDDRERAALCAAGRIRNYRAGEAIIRAVDPDRSVFVILNGAARVVAGARNGRAAILAIRGPGEIVGELAALDDGPRSATVEAAGPVRGLALGPARFAAALREHPRIMGLIASVAMDRLREADRRRVEFSTASVLPRTAAVILEFAEKQGPPAGCPLRLDIFSQADLAGLVATSRESIARALAALRTTGAITTARGSITILNMGRLRDVAER